MVSRGSAACDLIGFVAPPRVERVWVLTLLPVVWLSRTPMTSYASRFCRKRATVAARTATTQPNRRRTLRMPVRSRALRVRRRRRSTKLPSCLRRRRLGYSRFSVWVRWDGVAWLRRVRLDLLRGSAASVRKWQPTLLRHNPTRGGDQSSVVRWVHDAWVHEVQVVLGRLCPVQEH